MLTKSPGVIRARACYVLAIANPHHPTEPPPLPILTFSDTLPVMASPRDLLQQPKSPQRHHLFIAISAIIAFLLLFFVRTACTITRIERHTPIPLHPKSLDQPLGPVPIVPRTSSDYQLPEILNIPSFTSLRQHRPLDSDLIHSEAARRNNSILYDYAQQPTACAVTPSISRLRKAAQSYFRRHHTMDSWKQNDVTLTIYHDPVKLDLAFVQAAANLAKSFKRVRLLVPDPRLQHRLNMPVVTHYRNSTDDSASFMFAAAHLLVHTGPMSALGALVTSGTVYHTDALHEYTSQNAFKWLLPHRVPLSPEKITPYLPSLSFMGRVRPSCCHLRPFGKHDEEKIACANTAHFVDPCWILSVGSKGKFGFENDIVKNTQCYVHTFDCTGTWRVPENIAHRVTLHKLCLGDKSEGLFRTWEELIHIGSSAVTGSNGTMPSFAKMDIEGYEFPVIKALTSVDNTALPQQLAVEIHQHTSHPVGPPYERINPHARRGYVSDASIGQLFQNLSKKGYDLVYRSDNPFCPMCSEVTLVRRSALPAE